MPSPQPKPWRMLRRRLYCAVAACSAFSGCAGFWDDVTSRDFHFKDMFKKAPPPMEVIRTTHDGDKKSKALRALREPLQNGGTQQQQDEVVNVLVKSAISDPEPLCRLAAISTLQHFKDPRAGQALINAFERAADFQRERTDVIATIRSQALAGMGINGNPIAVPFLIDVLKASAPSQNAKNRQEDLEQRIVAARALAHFPQYEAAESLVAVLSKDQDVAMRNRATESLREMTGQELPGDAQAWAAYLHKSGKEGLAKKPSLGDKFLKLVSFPSKEKAPADNKDKSSP